MIFIDANVMLRHLTQPVTSQDVAFARLSTELFGQLRDALVTGTTSQATVAEVVFILSSARHYGLSALTRSGGHRQIDQPPWHSNG